VKVGAEDILRYVAFLCFDIASSCRKILYFSHPRTRTKNRMWLSL